MGRAASNSAQTKHTGGRSTYMPQPPTWACPSGSGSSNHSIFTSQSKRLISLSCLFSESLGNSRICSSDIFKKNHTYTHTKGHGRPAQVQKGHEPFWNAGMPGCWLLAGPWGPEWAPLSLASLDLGPPGSHWKKNSITDQGCHVNTTSL